MPAPMGTVSKGFVQSGKGNCMGTQAVVYDDFSGILWSVTFLSGQWWITTPGVKLQPLEEWFEDEDISFRFLCEAGGRVGALALAQLLGQALQYPEDDVQTTLYNRVAALRRLGVNLDLEEHLPLQLNVFALPERCSRNGKYAAWCRLFTDTNEMLFEIDGFNTKKEAEDYCALYFEVLQELGISFTV